MRTAVAFIIGSFRYGGAERDLLELCRRLDPDRYEIHVYYVERTGPLLADVEATGVRLHPLGIQEILSAPGLRAVRRCRAELARHGVRVLLGFGVYGSFYAAVLGWRRPELAVVSYEFTPVAPAGFKARLFQPWYYRRADAIVCNSDAVTVAVQGRWGARGKRFVKIQNGVDAARFTRARPVARESIEGLPAGAPVVGAVGRLNPIKGHEYLVAAWPRVAERFPEARLLLVGPSWPHDRERMERAARATGCADRILFLGMRGDVPGLLPLMDVVALPSLTEGFSNVIMEAGAAGRPVVATRVGGNPEAIVEGETGLLVPPRDPEALAGGIIRLLGDSDLRIRMGDAARRRVLDFFSVEKMVAGYDDLFRSFVRETPAGSAI